MSEVRLITPITRQNAKKMQVVARQFFCETRTEFLRKISPFLRSKSETRSLAPAAPKSRREPPVQRGGFLGFGRSGFCRPSFAVSRPFG